MYRKRMYCLVLRHLSPLDKGIQAAHACMEYSVNYRLCEDYFFYVKDDKTLIILNGGTSSELIEIEKELNEREINFSSFREPDMNNCITAIALIADERIWDTETYPLYSEGDYDDYVLKIGGEDQVFLKELLLTKRLAQ